MNVASLELCQELYELSWKKVDGLPYEVSNDGQIRYLRYMERKEMEACCLIFQAQR